MSSSFNLLELRSAEKSEIRQSPDYFWDNSRRGELSHLIFQYTWDGEGTFRDVHGQLHPIPAGYALLTTNREETAYFYAKSARQPWHFGWISFLGAEAFWQGLRSTYGHIVPLNRQGETIGIFEEICQRYREKSFLDRFYTSELLYRFLMRMGRELDASDQLQVNPSERAYHYIVDHYQRPLSVKEIAQKFGLSREHFIRTFTARWRQSPGALLRRLRLESAERLLRMTNWNVAMIAQQSGYASTSHFCRSFQQYQGCSPREFREKQTRG